MSFEFHYYSVAEALYEALCDDPFYFTLEKSIPDKLSPKESMIQYMDYSMQEADKYGILYLPKENPFGASVWSRPIDPDKEELRSAHKKSFLKEELGELALHTYLGIVEFMSVECQSVVNDEFWYLSIIGIKPEHQGKGLGVELVRPILIEADKAGCPTYLETFSPRNKKFYERIGYQAIKKVTEPITRSDYWIMTREPQIS